MKSASLCRASAAVFLCAAGMLVAAPAFAAKVAIRHAEIVNGKLQVSGVARPANVAVTLDGKYNSRANAWGAFNFSVIYHPTDCIVSVSLAANVAPARAVVANCAPGLNVRGNWRAAARYATNDLVNFGGAVWRAVRNSSGKAPTGQSAFWDEFIGGGERGPRGPKGNDGPVGPQGPAGPNTLANGSIAAPALSFTSDPDTGIFSPGADRIALVAGGKPFLHNVTNNVGLGFDTLDSITSGQLNVAVGNTALQSVTSGHNNIALGAAMDSNTVGSNNIALGTNALLSATSGNNNIALGTNALSGITTGSSNIAFGINAGTDAVGGANLNIFIGNTGEAGDDRAIRIGSSQDSAFIAGIRGVTTGVADGVPVVIDSNGQLGTVSSSRRYKDDIQTMPDMSATLGKLRPVTFRYKKPYADGSKPLRYGLIAEEVAQVMPALAVFNKDGTPETVKYHLLPSLLLSGYQAQQKLIAAQADEIAALKVQMQQLAAHVAAWPKARAKTAALQ